MASVRTIPAYWYLIGIVIMGCVYVVVQYVRSGSAVQPSEPASLSHSLRAGEVPIPVFSTSTRIKLEKSGGFQALLSYTDQGFEPLEVTIHTGDTVRFMNSSSNDVWIAAGGSALQAYPRTRDVCGSSDLDSCGPFAPQDFWEFTFEQAGEWEVLNNLDKKKKGTIKVQ